MLQRTFDGDLAFGAAVPFEFIHVQRGHQKGIEVDIADGDFAVERKWIGESQVRPPDSSPGAHRRTEFQLGDAAVRGQFAVEAADHFLSYAQIDDSESSIRFGSGHRPVRLHAERDLPVDGESRGLQFFEIRQGNGGADQIDGDIAIRACGIRRFR